MAAQYHSLFTTQGLALLREAIQTGAKLGITHMAYGDGNGIVPTPNADFTKLVREVYRAPLNRLAPSKDNQNWLEADGVIPSAVGGFNIREVGLYAGNVLVAYANYPSTYKPLADQGTAQIKTIRIVLQIDNTANFELKIDASVVMATIQTVEEAKQDAIKYADETKMHTLNSIADLANLSTWDGRTISIKSYHPGLKKGGGEFVYDSSLKNVNDGGIVFNGWVRNKFSKIYASYFGTRCDGEYDDAIAVNKALDYLESKKLLDLYLDQETHTFKSGFGKRDVTIIGTCQTVKYNGQKTKFIVDSATKLILFDVESNVRFVNIWGYGISAENKTVQHELLPLMASYMTGWVNSRFEKFEKVLGLATVYHEFKNCHIVANKIGVELYKLKGKEVNGVYTPGNPSTMLQLNESVFTYNDYGIKNDSSSRIGLYSGGEFVNIKCSGTGFELSKNGIWSNATIHLLTLKNCWFEENSEYGLYTPNSNVLEINTKHESNSPRSVSDDFYSQVSGSTLKNPNILTKKITPIKTTERLTIDSPLGVYFGRQYSDNANTALTGPMFDFGFSGLYGTAYAGYRFDRVANNGQAYQSFIKMVFYTGAIQNVGGDSKVDRWELTHIGDFQPCETEKYNLGSESKVINSSFVKTRKYTSTVFDSAGTGSPEGFVAAAVGSTYRRIDGEANKTFYVKETGVGNTGWIAK